MIRRFLLAAVLAVVMVVSGTATYVYLGGKQSKVAAPPEKPTAATPRAQALVLPGTLYIAQSGAIYRLSAGRFHQITPEAGWSQPSAFPDGSNLLAVKSGGYYSDVYILNRFGTPVRQLTANASRVGMKDPSSNHWSFYPRLGPDGQTLWMSYDSPKFGYDVVFSIWAMPVSGTIRQGKVWTNSADYTGGDIQPVPVKTGLIYTKYDYGPDSRLVGRLWFSNRAFSAGRPLTDPTEDCRSPAMSPDGTEVAMICTYEKQVSYLTIASWNGSTLGPRHNVITDQQVAQPAWAPDGSGIAYLAPGAPDGPFQLWWLPKDAYAPPAPSPIPTPTPTPGGPHNSPVPSASASAAPTPAPVKPIQVTTNLGFDATSPIAWLS